MPGYAASKARLILRCGVPAYVARLSEPSLRAASTMELHSASLTAPGTAVAGATTAAAVVGAGAAGTLVGAAAAGAAVGFAGAAGAVADGAAAWLQAASTAVTLERPR